MLYGAGRRGPAVSVAAGVHKGLQMRVLVTGGSGFLGFETARKLAGRGDTVIAFDTHIAVPLASLAAAEATVVPVAGDITDLANVAQLFKAYQPEAVVHFAAIVGVPASLSSPANILRVNVQGSLNLFEAMRLYGVKRVIHMSSEEVYGDFQSPVADEQHPKQPLLPYGISKLTVEQFGRTYRDLHGLECINLRTSWVYGVRLDRPRPPMNYLNAALKGAPLRLAAGGDTVTDFTYVEDVVDGVLRALDHPRHRYDVYNIASGTAVSDRALVDEIKALLPGADITIGPGRREFMPGVRIPTKGALDVTRAQDEFDYRPQYDIRRGLQAYIAEWRETNGAAAKEHV